MADTYAGTGSSEWLEKQAIVNAVASEDLQWRNPSLSPAWTGDGEWVTRGDFDAEVSSDRSLSGSQWITRSEAEVARIWDYSDDGDAPSLLSASAPDALGRSTVEWTNVTTMPAWVEAITEVAIEYDDGSGYTEIASPAHNGASSQSQPFSASSGDAFRVRYRCTRYGFEVSAYSNQAFVP